MRRPDPPRESFVERRIREAMEGSQLSKLKGYGKPLNLEADGDPSRDDWASNHVLKNAGMLPPWMELGKDIDKLEDTLAKHRADHERWIGEINRVTAEMTRVDLERRREGIQAIHRRHLARYGAGLDTLRHKVDRFNFIIPVPNLARAPVRREARLQSLLDDFRAIADRYGWPDQPLPAPVPVEDDDVPVKVLRLFDDSPDISNDFIPDWEEDEAAQAENRRQRTLALNRKVGRPRSSGVPLEWLAAINPIGHAAELFRKRKSEQGG